MNLEQRHGDGFDRTMLDRACSAVGGVLTSDADSPDRWLTEAAERLVGAMDEHLGAQAWIRLRLDPARPCRVLSAAVAGMPSRQCAESALRSVRSGFPEDDTTHAATTCVEQRGVHILRRSQMVSESLWATSNFRAWRASLGLYDFVRAIVPFKLIEGPGGLALQLDGLSPEWRPTDATVALFAAVAPAMARGYECRFVEPQRHRAAILDKLREIQRPIAPLLAEGHTERHIADQLGRSVHTIHEHTREIYRCLGVRNRRELRDLWLAVPASASPTSPTAISVFSVNPLPSSPSAISTPACNAVPESFV